jgi:ribosome-associated protein YbcJ (S4-like RNA binding protein)
VKDRPDYEKIMISEVKGSRKRQKLRTQTNVQFNDISSADEKTKISI